MLDSWAALAMLKAEPAGPRVLAVVQSGEARMSWINLGEVYYLEARRVGPSRAAAAVERLRLALVAEDADEQVTIAAATIKAEHGLGYADCFAVATAELRDAPLLTGDGELIELGRPGLEVVDLRG